MLLETCVDLRRLPSIGPQLLLSRRPRTLDALGDPVPPLLRLPLRVDRRSAFTEILNRSHYDQEDETQTNRQAKDEKVTRLTALRLRRR